MSAARPRAVSARARRQLLEALEIRLEALTASLRDALPVERGIDMIKEIKELHVLLETLRQQKRPAGASEHPPRFVVVWGEDSSRHSHTAAEPDAAPVLRPCGEGGTASSSSPPPAGSGKSSSSENVASAGAGKKRTRGKGNVRS